MLILNSVLEDILIYHLRLKQIFFFFFFLKKKFQKITSVNFVGSDPRLLEIGAKWRTHWAIILKVKKKIKGVRRLAQEAQPSDLYPYATKSDTWVQKKSSKNSKKQFFFVQKTQPGHRKELMLILNSVLEDILVYHLRLKQIFFFFFFEKKVSKKYKC